ncbi:hypothetical protein CYMTET_9416, partial [Cymbomonas tetramitiformis]
MTSQKTLKELSKAQAKVGQLEKTANEVSLLKQELEDRKHASRILKTTNERLKAELAQIQRRLSDIETSKEVGRCVIGGGAASTKALKRGVKDLEKEKKHSQEEVAAERREKEAAQEKVVEFESKAERAADQLKTAFADFAKEKAVKEEELSQLGDALERVQAEKTQKSQELEQSMADKEALSEKRKVDVKAERQRARRFYRPGSGRGKGWEYKRVHPRGEADNAPKKPHLERNADESPGASSESDDDSGGEEGLSDNTNALLVTLLGAELDDGAMGTNFQGSFLRVQWLAPGQPRGAVQQTRTVEGLSPAYKTCLQYVVQVDVELLEFFQDGLLPVELHPSGGGIAGGPPYLAIAHIPLQGVLDAQPAKKPPPADIPPGGPYEVVTLYEGAEKRRASGVLQYRLSMLRPVKPTLVVYNQLRPIALHPHAQAAHNRTEPLVVILAWSLSQLEEVVMVAQGTLGRVLREVLEDGAVSAKEQQQFDQAADSMVSGISKVVEQSHASTSAQLANERKASAVGGKAVLGDIKRHALVESMLAIKRLVGGAVVRLQNDVEVIGEESAEGMLDGLQQTLKLAGSTLKEKLDAWEYTLLGSVERLSSDFQEANLEARKKLVAVSDETCEHLINVVKALLRDSAGADTYLQEARGALHSGEERCRKILLLLKPVVLRAVQAAAGKQPGAGAGSVAQAAAVQETLQATREAMHSAAAALRSRPTKAAAPTPALPVNRLLQLRRLAATSEAVWVSGMADIRAQLGANTEGPAAGMCVKIRAVKGAACHLVQGSADDILHVFAAVAKETPSPSTPQAEVSALDTCVLQKADDAVLPRVKKIVAKLQQELERGVAQAGRSLDADGKEEIWDELQNAGEEIMEAMEDLGFRLTAAVTEEAAEGSLLAVLEREKQNHHQGPLAEAVGQLRKSVVTVSQSVGAAVAQLGAALQPALIPPAVPPPEPEAKREPETLLAAAAALPTPAAASEPLCESKLETLSQETQTDFAPVEATPAAQPGAIFLPRRPPSLQEDSPATPSLQEDSPATPSLQEDSPPTPSLQ